MDRVAAETSACFDVVGKQNFLITICGRSNLDLTSVDWIKIPQQPISETGLLLSMNEQFLQVRVKRSRGNMSLELGSLFISDLVVLKCAIPYFDRTELRRLVISDSQ